MKNKSQYDKIFTQAVYQLADTLSINTINQQMKEITGLSLISTLERIGNNEHLIESIKEKGLPKVVICSESKLLFCTIYFNFCKIKVHQLIDPECILFSWIDPVEFFSDNFLRDSLIPGTFTLTQL